MIYVTKKGEDWKSPTGTSLTEAAKALEDTVPALIRVLQDAVPTVRANAADALVRIGTPEAIQTGIAERGSSSPCQCSQVIRENRNT